MGKREDRRRREDLAFLDRVRTAATQDLETLRACYSHKHAPEWKKVAIERAIGRSKR